MRIVLIVAGSGGSFYCETCLRDAAWATVMRSHGHDVIITPMYLPVNMEGVIGENDTPVFFGGINVYLREQFAWLRHAPNWLTAWLDSRFMLRLASRRAGATQADGLGSMTLSMLQGRNGHHATELNRLAQWLEHERPDAIVLSSILLAGLAGPLRDALDCPILAFAHDEDTWLDALDAPYDKHCWDAMQAAMQNIAMVIAVSHSYANQMAQRLALPQHRISTVYPGIEPEIYRPSTNLESGIPVVGYLSKMTPSLGLETLVEAIILLRHEYGFEQIKLAVMGGLTGDDHHFVKRLQDRLQSVGMADAATFLTGVDRNKRIAFLEQLSVLSVPIAHGEAFGTFIIESLAAGVPVVLPEAGAFPEIIQATRGGTTYHPNTPDALAATLADLLHDRAKARIIGQRGLASVKERFTVDRMAGELEELIKRVIQSLE